MRDLKDQILHVCVDGERLDVHDVIECGMKYCPWCGVEYAKEGKESEMTTEEKIKEYLTKHLKIEIDEDLSDAIWISLMLDGEKIDEARISK